MSTVETVLACLAGGIMAGFGAAALFGYRARTTSAQRDEGLTLPSLLVEWAINIDPATVAGAISTTTDNVTGSDLLEALNGNKKLSDSALVRLGIVRDAFRGGGLTNGEVASLLGYYSDLLPGLDNGSLRETLIQAVKTHPLSSK